MPVILLTEHLPGIIQQVHTQLQHRYGLTDIDISTRFIRDLPRDESGYSIYHLKDICITDYYPLKNSCMYVDDVSNASVIAECIASKYIKPIVHFCDELDIAKSWLEMLPDTFSYDTETLGLAIKDIGQITMHSFSAGIFKSAVIIDSPKIREAIFEFLTTTDKKVICHNLAFDMRPIYRSTRKFIKNYEDTQLLANVYLNHTKQPKLSLKALAGTLYGDWASAKTTFNLYENSSSYVNEHLHYVGTNKDTHKYNLPLIYYAGIDASATMHLWDKFSSIHPEWKSVPMNQLLPIEEPRYYEETPRFFYENVLKHLVTTNIELLETPMPIDMDIIDEIKQTALKQREPALQKLREFPAVQKYMEGVRTNLVNEFVEPLLRKQASQPIRGYKHNPADRTFVLNYITGESRKSWTIADINKLIPVSEYSELLQLIINKDILVAAHSFIQEAMNTHKKSNQIKAQHKIDNPLQYINPKQLSINPNASAQMKGLWKSLGLESDVMTKGGEESFNSDVITEISKTTTDPIIKEIIEQVLLISDTKNLLSQYIPAYEHSSKNGFCYQSMRVPGTLSYRISGAIGKIDKSVISNEPLSGFGVSMVTQPGITKRAVIAPNGFVIATSDYAGLEGVIGACLTHDPNKVAIFNDGLDLHCLNAASFFKEDVEQTLGRPVENTLEFNQFFNSFRKTNKLADKLRADAKSPNYLLEYGGYPKKLSKDLKCSLETAQSIFDKFHGETFLGTTRYRENYVLPQAQANGYIHLGLGAVLRTDDAKKDVRTITNATYQFWSILTLLALHQMLSRIKDAGYSNDIFIYSTIHDSITAYIKEDPTIIKWYNDNLIECMVGDFLLNQEVKLESNVDIGKSYNKCIELPNNCSVEHITTVLFDLATIEAKLATLKD